MKKKITYLSIILITFICALFLINNKSYAGSQQMEKLEYDVELNSDGSADVVETWNIRVSDTNTLFKTFDLDSSKYSGITDVSVLELSETGVENSFLKTNQYSYHVNKGYYYALNTNSKEFEIAWGVSIGNAKNKIYKISYKIQDAVKNYNDCSEFYWQFLGTTNGIPCDYIKGTIKLPKTVQNKENIKVWAHGPLNGEIYAINNNTVSFEVRYLETRTMVEARIAVLEKIFNENKNVVNTDKLQSIINEETKWAEQANIERENLKRAAEREEMIFKILFVAAILLGLAIVVFLVTKIVKYTKELKNIETIEPREKPEYFRDFPDEDATPTEAAFLYYFDNKGAFKQNVSKVVSSIILDLSLKKVIRFEKDKKDNVNIVLEKDIDTQTLKKDEIAIYNLLADVEKYKNKKNNEYDNNISMKDIEKYARNNDSKFLGKIDGLESSARMLHEIKKNYNDEMRKISEKWSSKGGGYFAAAFMGACFVAFIFPAFSVIPCIICGVLCKKIANKTHKLELTQKGTDEKELWKALKKYMENFSLLNEREVPELVLWEKYLIFATAFGIADKVLKQLKIKYPELMDEDYMLNNGYMYMYMMNRYNFDRALNSGIQKAYSTGLAQKAAREAASSSGSGGGGGFSGGGGRRRRPEAGMGGR